jgi:hypothetical protein
VFDGPAPETINGRASMLGECGQYDVALQLGEPDLNLQDFVTEVL